MAYLQNTNSYTVLVPTYIGGSVEVPSLKYVDDNGSGFYASLIASGELVEYTGPSPDPGDIVYTYVSSGGVLTEDMLGVPLGAASLDALGVLDTDQLPPLSITSVFTVASQAEMLALTAQQGDVAIRTDLSKSFILATNSPSTLADWKELLGSAGITGSLTAGRIPVATGTSQVSDYAGFTFDGVDALSVSRKVTAPVISTRSTAVTGTAPTITNASNATPIIVTATAHGLLTGDFISISGITGNTNANGFFKITWLSANTFSLQNYLTGVDIVGNGAYGGTPVAVVGFTLSNFVGSSLTSGRVPIIGSNGLITDDAGLTASGTGNALTIRLANNVFLGGANAGVLSVTTAADAPGKVHLLGYGYVYASMANDGFGMTSNGAVKIGRAHV